MTAFLRVNENGQARNVAVLPAGRLLIVGRSEQADVPFPQDSLMSSRHLSIQIQNQQCLITDLGSTNGTTVNGQRIESAAIDSGDVFCCGTTLFSVEWSGSAEGGIATQYPTVQDVAPTIGYAARFADEILKRFRLRQSIPLTPEDGETCVEFLQRLQRLPEGTAEIEFLSFALPKRSAVWWMIVCARTLTELLEEEVSVLELGEKWVLEPSDAGRRAVFSASQEEDPGRVAHWVGSAAYFSGGSIAPPNSPMVAPSDRVTGQCVLAGITMAALAGPPSELKARRKQMAQVAIRIAAEGIQTGKIR
jgi:hypothetical protein